MYDNKNKSLSDVESKLTTLEVDLEILKTKPNVEILEERIKSAKERISSYLSNDLDREKQYALINILNNHLDNLNSFVRNTINKEVTKLFNELHKLKEFTSDFPNTQYLLDTFENLGYIRNDNFNIEHIRKYFTLIKFNIHNRDHFVLIDEKHPNIIEEIQEKAKNLLKNRPLSSWDKDYEGIIYSILPKSRYNEYISTDYLLFNKDCVSLNISETHIKEIPKEFITAVNFWKTTIGVPVDLVSEIEKHLKIIITDFEIFHSKKDPNNPSKPLKVPIQSLAYDPLDHRFYKINHKKSKESISYLTQLLLQ